MLVTVMGARAESSSASMLPSSVSMTIGISARWADAGAGASTSAIAAHNAVNRMAERRSAAHHKRTLPDILFPDIIDFPPNVGFRLALTLTLTLTLTLAVPSLSV